MTNRFTVSIINYRTAQMTIDCVRSVLEDLDERGQVIIVDNCSGDGSAEEIEAWITAQGPDIPARLVRSPTNSGYSGGHNQGMGAAPADYYLILNSDALLRPGFFDAMQAAIETHPQAGMIVPRLEGEDGVVQGNCFRFPGLASEFMRGAMSGPVTRLLKRHEISLESAPPDDQIEWASFACILLNGGMVDQIGMMDEGYFLYYEDSEYCLRARRAGWRMIRQPEAIAVHFRGGSGPVKELARVKKRAPEYYYRSRSRFLTQAHGRAGLIAANLLWYTGHGLAQLRRLAGKHVHKPAQGELGDIWIGARRPLDPFRPKG